MNEFTAVVCQYSWYFEPQIDPFWVKKLMQMEETEDEVIRTGSHCTV